MYSATWPKRGMTRSGVASVPPTSEPPTAGRGCSYWRGCAYLDPDGDAAMLPTPTAHDGSSNGVSAASRQGGPSLLDRLRLLPTPRASDTGTAGRRAGAGFRPPLSQQVLPLVDPEAFLPTPRATDGTKGCPAQRGSKGDLMLPSAVIRLLVPPAPHQAGDSETDAIS